jgi:hypothetical protein
MSIVADCGVDVGKIVRTIYSGKKISHTDVISNYVYEGWTLMHYVAFYGNEEAIKDFLDISDESFDIEAPEPYHDSDRTPRTILKQNHPELYKKLKCNHYI